MSNEETPSAEEFENATSVYACGENSYFFFFKAPQAARKGDGEWIFQDDARKYKEHSIILNRMAYKIGLAMGETGESFVRNPEEDLDILIARKNNTEVSK